MAHQDRNSLIRIAIILLISTSFGKGAYEQCLASLRNTVVYEGTLNTILNCPAGPNETKWTVRPTSNAGITYTITSFDNTVAPNLAGLYALDPSGLLVRNATINATGGPISTAGYYTVEFPSTTNKTAAKLIVIRSGPTCFYNQSASTGFKITCNITYADHPVAPIYPILNCTVNGQSYTNTTYSKTSVATNVNNYGLTVTVNISDPAAYNCTMTFAPPNTILYPFVAKNAPDFSVTISGGPSTVAPSTTTTKAITTSTKASTTTKTQIITSTRPPITSTIQPSTSTRPPITSTIQPSTSTRPPITSTIPTSTITTSTRTQTTLPREPSTTATAIQASTSASMMMTSSSGVPMSTEFPPKTTQLFSSSTSSSSSTVASTTPSTIQSTTGSSEVGLLATKITLGIILGILMAVTATLGCFFCCPYFCLPLLPYSTPKRYADGEILMGQRREWIPVRRRELIPVRREICQTDYVAIPFYQQSFCRYSAPYDYRLPTRCT